MKRYFVATACALALLGVAAPSAPAAPGSAMMGASAASGPELMKRLEADSRAAQAKIAGDPAASKALAEAVHAKRADQVKAVLLQAGFPPADLNRSKLSLVDKTGKGGGDASRIKITITVKCCPPEIIVTIQF